MVRLLVSKVAARSSARCLPLPCSSSTIAKRRSVRFIYSSLPLLDCSLASPFSLAYHVLLCLTTSLFSKVFFLFPSPPQTRGKEGVAGCPRPRPTGNTLFLTLGWGLAANQSDF